MLALEQISTSAEYCRDQLRAEREQVIQAMRRDNQLRSVERQCETARAEGRTDILERCNELLANVE